MYLFTGKVPGARKVFDSCLALYAEFGPELRLGVGLPAFVDVCDPARYYPFGVTEPSPDPDKAS